MKNRVIIIVLDSLGIGELPDAIEYNDVGSNTLKNIYKSVKQFSLPNLEKLGITNIEGLSEIKKSDQYNATIARCAEKSKGKDTTTGHWEISGLILDNPFPVFPNGFPQKLIRQFEDKIGRKILGNIVASGTEIIKDLGVEHINTGSPIVYTSADSVFQIAAHEDVISVKELYSICQIARDMLIDDYNVGRVIARPFIGTEGNFKRTENRKDFSVKPFKDTMLDYLKNNGKHVLAVGKISDIFSNKGISESIHTKNNADGIEETIKAINKKFDGLIFTNLVDFDMLYGHRNDVIGYSEALKYFDSKLPEIISSLDDNDILIITADHGCDPTTESTDHSREYIPLIIYGNNIKKSNNLGTLETYACIGKTILDIFDIDNDLSGYSVKDKILR